MRMKAVTNLIAAAATVAILNLEKIWISSCCPSPGNSYGVLMPWKGFFITNSVTMNRVIAMEINLPGVVGRTVQKRQMQSLENWVGPGARGSVRVF